MIYGIEIGNQQYWKYQQYLANSVIYIAYQVL